MIDKQNPPKFLIQKGTNRVYAYTPAIGGRSDMEAYEMPEKAAIVAVEPVVDYGPLIAEIAAYKAEVARLQENDTKCSRCTASADSLSWQRETEELKAKIARLTSELEAAKFPPDVQPGSATDTEIDPDEQRLLTIKAAAKSIPVENYTKGTADNPPAPRVKDVEAIVGFKVYADEIDLVMSLED